MNFELSNKHRIYSIKYKQITHYIVIQDMFKHYTGIAYYDLAQKEIVEFPLTVKVCTEQEGEDTIPCPKIGHWYLALKQTEHFLYVEDEPVLRLRPFNLVVVDILKNQSTPTDVLYDSSKPDEFQEKDLYFSIYPV